MLQLKEYSTFIDKGTYATHKIPRGFQRIKVYLVFAAKYDGRHKSRLVSRGEMTDIPTDSVYTGVVSLEVSDYVFFLESLMIWKPMQHI